MKNQWKVIISSKTTIRWGDKQKSRNNNNIIGPFSQGGLEKPNPARTIDTLADGS